MPEPNRDPDNTGDQDLSRRGQRPGPGPNVRCQAGDRIVPVLHLTGVPPGPDLESKVADDVADIACASHRAGWTGEGREEALESLPECAVSGLARE
jgi:hypothetical protein